MAAKVYIDFESRSACDLKRAGVHKYAEDPTTSILCLAWAFDDEPVVVAGLQTAKIHQGSATNEDGKRLLAHIRSGGKVVAHNAAFEITVWNTIIPRMYAGWPLLTPEQTDCTMARCYAMALPGSLERASAALGITQQKDMKGQRLMLKFAQPRSENPLTWYEDAEDLKKLYAYCAQDVEVERAIDKRCMALSATEKKVWILDQKINNRGVGVDVESALKAIQLVDAEQDRLNKEIRLVSKNQIATHRAHTQVRDWVNARGVRTTGVAKNDVINLLASDDLPRDVRRVLEIRQEAAKSSTAKLKAMVDGASADFRLKGIFQYHGAATGRWAGRRVQPHNFPRQEYDPKIFDILQLPTEEARETLHMFYGSPLSVVSSALRGFIWADFTGQLIAIDFSAIEARVLAWLAGEETVLEVFRTHGKIYEVAASAIFGVPIDQVTKEMRAVGKVAILALGYQGGVGAFQAMARGYGVRMGPAFKSLWDAATESAKEWALKRWAQEEKNAAKAGIDKQDWLASELTKIAWRESNPNIVAYWADTEAAALDAVRNPGKMFHVRNITYCMSGSFLFCRLPSGRALCYPYPKIEIKKTPWGASKELVTYMAEDSMIHKWIRVSVYGGLLVENITQAVARDLLAEAMLRLDAHGHHIVMHVHDETVIEAFNGESVDDIRKIVDQLPDWAVGLPIESSGFRGKRYRK